MVTILMPAKLATPGLLVFWSERYDVIIFLHDVIKKILSRDSKYMVKVGMWPKFGNSRISLTKIIIITIL